MSQKEITETRRNEAKHETVSTMEKRGLLLCHNLQYNGILPRRLDEGLLSRAEERLPEDRTKAHLCWDLWVCGLRKTSVGLDLQLTQIRAMGEIGVRTLHQGLRRLGFHRFTTSPRGPSTHLISS